MTDHCDYYGCTRPLCESRSDNGKYYCREHDEEFVSAGELAANGDAMPLIRFMIGSYGGYDRAVHDAREEAIQ